MQVNSVGSETENVAPAGKWTMFELRSARSRCICLQLRMECLQAEQSVAQTHAVDVESKAPSAVGDDG